MLNSLSNGLWENQSGGNWNSSFERQLRHR